MSDKSDLDLKLIKAVQKRPYLYDKSNFPISQNEVFILKTWTKIGQELKLPKEYCMTQWTNLRKRYTRSPHSKWTLAPHLSFLEPYIKRKPKKDKTDQPNDCTSTPSNVKEIKNQSKGAAVLPKTLATSKVQKKVEKRDGPVKCVQLPPVSSILQKQSNQSFCESLSNDLQTLTAEQQMKCRIDILTIITKYRNPTNNSDPKSVIEDNHSDLSVPNISKRFAAISDKISKGTMTPFDDDWLLIFTVKNFFCQLMEVRKTNVELDRMLPSFKSNDSTNVMNEEQIQGVEKQYDFKAPYFFEMQNNLTEGTNKNSFQDMQAPLYEDDPYSGAGSDLFKESAIKTEPKSSDEAYFFADGNLPQELAFDNKGVVESILTSLNGSSSNSITNASISAQENRNLETNTRDTLKNLNTSDGIMHDVDGSRFLCLLCDITSCNDMCNTHTLSSGHEALMKEYLMKSAYIKDIAIPQLDPSVYTYQFGGLYCLKCDARMQNRNNFLIHTKSLKHKNQLKTLPISLDTDMLGDRSVGKGIVKINKRDYCLLCDVKIFVNPSIMHAVSPDHKKVIALLEGVFKMSSNHGYCTHCNEVFSFPKLDLHANQEKHISKVIKELEATL